MSIYLYLQCGSYPVLLDTSHVVEISERTSAISAAQQRLWHDRELPVINLADVLGTRASARSEQIVLGSRGSAIAIADVDRVIGVVNLPETEFSRPDQTASIAGLSKLVDGVWQPAADSNRVFRLRYPFPWLASSIGPVRRRA